MNKKTLIRAVALGAIMATVYVVVATVIGELYKPYKNFLAEVHYHHWVGKSIWAMLIFCIVATASFFSTKNKGDVDSTKAMQTLAYALVIGTFILTLFYIYEYLIHY